MENYFALKEFAPPKLIAYLDNDTTFNSVINSLLPHHKEFRKEYMCIYIRLVYDHWTR